MDESKSDVHWVRTVGAPAPGDGRDGEVHEVRGVLHAGFDLEPWDDDVNGIDAHYVRSDSPPVLDKEGRLVWEYRYAP